MKYPIPFALLLCGSAAAMAAEPTHCSSAEEVVYSCRVRTSPKVVSLCASKGLAAGSGYLQYRFGRPGNVELEFPQAREGSPTRFEYAHYFRAQFDLTEVRFRNEGVEYAIYQYYNGEEKPARSETGVRVGDVSLACGRPVTNRLSTLESVLPRGPI